MKAVGSRLAIQRPLPVGHAPARRAQHGIARRRVPFHGRGRRGDRCRPRPPPPGRISATSRHWSGPLIGRLFSNASVLGIGMGLAGSPPPARRRPARAPRWPRVHAVEISKAPLPTSPTNSRPMAGANTTPATGTPSTISPILTVNSPPRLMNSLVPSTGSTRKKRDPTCGDAARRGFLFRHHRHAGKGRGQFGQDQLFGFLVGIGHRRAVGLHPRIARRPRNGA